MEKVVLGKGWKGLTSRDHSKHQNPKEGVWKSPGLLDAE